MIEEDSFMNLLLFLGLSGSAVTSLYYFLSGIALQQSFSVWRFHNRHSDSLGT